MYPALAGGSFTTWEALYYNYKILHICYNLSPTHKTSSLNHYGNSVEYLLCSAGKDSIFLFSRTSIWYHLYEESKKKKKKNLFTKQKQNYIENKIMVTKGEREEE